MFRLLTKRLFSKTKIDHIPTLKQFITQISPDSSQHQHIDPIPSSSLTPGQIKTTYYIQSYGCQMNVSDTELVRSILADKYTETDQQTADIVMLNTCAIRDSAEQKIYQRVNELKRKKMIAVLGCMAQRVKERMIEKGVHIVCGPDSYRELPRLIEVAKAGEQAIDVQLSVEETYAELSPIRKNPNSVTAFLSIMRGCNNMCSFCIVPQVRGRQRSRPLPSIVREVGELVAQGVKQVTLLGQNVNSYHDYSDNTQSYEHKNSEDFVELYKIRSGPGPRFAQLLDTVATAYPEVRFRFTSPHPKDFPDDVINVMAKHPNICKYIHLPAQSGNTEMLKRMRRNHSRQAYLNLVTKLKSRMPGLTLSTDLICGFCGQTQQEFNDTISLLREVKYEMAFLFAYSMRPKTHAHRNFKDDIPEHIKQSRLQKMIQVFQEEQATLNKKQIGKYHLILVEGNSKRDSDTLMGKTDTFKKSFIPKTSVPTITRFADLDQSQPVKTPIKPGDFVLVKVKDVSPRSLYCEPLAKMTISDYANDTQLRVESQSL